MQLYDQSEMLSIPTIQLSYIIIWHKKYHIAYGLASRQAAPAVPSAPDADRAERAVEGAMSGSPGLGRMDLDRAAGRGELLGCRHRSQSQVKVGGAPWWNFVVIDD